MMQLDIAIGKHRNAISWRNVTWDWLQVSEKCSTVHRTAETFAEYVKLPKSRRDEIKDIGGFVGGFLANGRRKKGNVVHRQVITLDLDYADLDAWPDWEMMQSCASLMYSTHSHSPASPRYRLVVPLDRPVTPSEYEPIIRRVAASINIERVDHSSYDLNRLMYWPSASKDGDFQFFCQEGEPLCADDVLASYVDWRDVSSWPMGSRENKDLIARAKKQGDPLEKPGLIGAFCRIYDVETAIEAFLSDVYEPCEVEGRYTFLSGTTAAGLVIHDQGRFAFSHHSTDPISGKLCNAFDLVRIHKFGHLDDAQSESTPENKKQSYLAMLDFIGKDKQVVHLLAQEKLEEAGMDFAGLGDEDGEPDLDWTSHLKVDRKGNIDPGYDNTYIILKHDPNLKGKIRYNEFSDMIEVKGKLPWERPADGRLWSDFDWSGLRKYIGSEPYEIKSDKQIKDCLYTVAYENRFHSVRDYLNNLKWDGVPRLETVFVDYLGAENTLLNREMSRKAMTAAVHRIMVPGCKWDYILTFISNEGAGKSTLLNNLGRFEWFTDSFNFGMLSKGNGKMGFEQIQNKWIIELAEMTGLSKAEVEAVKAFITSREDYYRPSHKESMVSRKRQCIFFGTTNRIEFLVSQTGNRRFWPIPVQVIPPTKTIQEVMPAEEINQLWAEAVYYYHKGEDLYLPPELEEQIRAIQAGHTETDPREERIQWYLDALLPENWADMSIYQKRSFLATGDDINAVGKIQRDRVSISEIWSECFEGSAKDMTSFNTKFIRDFMRKKVVGWEQHVYKSHDNKPVRGYARVLLPFVEMVTK